MARLAALRRCAAAAAVVGGTAWTIKAAVTLVTGNEPRGTFAIGLALFPFALLGLWSLVRSSGGRAPAIGGALAAAAATSVVIAAFVRAFGGAAVEPSEDEITALTPFITIAGFGTFAALLALGIAARRSGALAAPYHSLPWAMAVATIPLLLIGGALEAVSERLLEVPIALLGIGWITIGAAMWSAAQQHPDHEIPE